MSTSRQWDIVVYGATGFTGKLVLEHLKSQAATLKLAVAGRSKAKLETTLQELSLTHVEPIIADSNDEESLKRMCSSTTALISLVGPYALHGDKVVAAAASCGTHYFDLAGETLWQLKTIQRISRTAADNHAIIVMASGFDSVPSDIGAMLAVRELKRAGVAVSDVGQVVSGFSAKGGVSGGTVASVMATMDGHSVRELAEVHRNLYLLSPVKGIQAVFNKFIQRQPGLVGGRFIMAPTNSHVVRRSWGILESLTSNKTDSNVEHYGPNFTYDEFHVTHSAISAFFLSFFLTMFSVALLMPPVRWLIKRLGPQSGDGPSEATRKNGWWKCQTTAHSVQDDVQVRVTISSKGDPGYEWTSICIAESALAVIEDYDRLTPHAREGGALTPATALGDVLVQRLQKIGRLKVESTMLKNDRKKSI